MKQATPQRFVRGTPNHSFRIVALLLGVSERTVKNMVDDHRLKSTSIVDVVEYVRQASGRLGNSPPTPKQTPEGKPHPVRNVE